MHTSRQTVDRVFPFLKKSTFLGCLSDVALEALVRKGRTKGHTPGEVICWRGDAGDYVMVVLSGQLKVTNAVADGREIALNFLGAGDVVGEIAVLDGMARTANVVALEASEVFVIDRPDLLAVLNAHPEAMFEIIQALCQKLRTATSIIEDNTHEMQARVARGLIRLAEQHGFKSQNQIRIKLKLSQTELGNYLGLSRANVNRQLGQLRDMKAIEIGKTGIVILDQAYLLEAAQGAPARGK